MLAWCGVFGLGSAAYFMGRTHPELLIALFPTWALTLALLTVEVVERLARRADARAGLGTALVLAATALTVCSLARSRPPWTQLERIGPGHAERAADRRRSAAAALRQGVPAGPLDARLLRPAAGREGRDPADDGS